VDPLAVVVLDVLAEQTSEVVFAENDDVIEQLPSNAPHEALRGPVLPRASECRALGVDVKASDRQGDFGREDRIVVENQIPMRRAMKKRLAQLPAGASPIEVWTLSAL
jgi:hypothetical protein